MMKYFIYKLKFLTPVRFGTCNAGAELAQGKMACTADTLFSALCQEWIAVFGQKGFDELIAAVQGNQIFLSDMFPWCGLELYLPKPAMPPSVRRNTDVEGLKDRKALKKLVYIPVSRFADYIKFLHNGGDLPWLEEIEEPGYEQLLYRANIAREQDTVPYPVMVYRFKENSGLYFILRSTEYWRERFDIVVESLGLTGIGGKRSSGLGKFELAEESFETGLYDSDIMLEKMLLEDANLYMLLSVLSPGQEELGIAKQANSYYNLVKRTGYVASPDYADTWLKKKPVVMFGAGSCFPEKIRGRVLDVSDCGGHPVYRYGKGMYVGVKV